LAILSVLVFGHNQKHIISSKCAFIYVVLSRVPSRVGPEGNCPVVKSLEATASVRGSCGWPQNPVPGLLSPVLFPWIWICSRSWSHHFANQVIICP